MRKTGLILILILILTVVIIIFFNYNVFVATQSPILGYKLSCGVGNYGNNNQYYFIDSSANNFYFNYYYLDYRPYITAAMNRWIHTNVYTPISFLKTTIQQNSVIDIYVQESYSTFAGITYQIVGSSVINPRTQNWNWCKVILNANYLQYDSIEYHIQAAVAHELGHCFGLDDNEIPGSVMYKYLSGILDGGPSTEDCNAINRIY